MYIEILIYADGCTCSREFAHHFCSAPPPQHTNHQTHTQHENKANISSMPHPHQTLLFAYIYGMFPGAFLFVFPFPNLCLSLHVSTNDPPLPQNTFLHTDFVYKIGVCFLRCSSPGPGKSRQGNINHTIATSLQSDIQKTKQNVPYTPSSPNYVICTHLCNVNFSELTCWGQLLGDTFLGLVFVGLTFLGLFF